MRHRPAALGQKSGASGQVRQQIVLKRFTDVDFQLQLAGEMIVRKVQYAGADDMIIPAYLFMPRDTSRRHATIVMVHEDLHGDFKTLYVPELRALVRARIHRDCAGVSGKHGLRARAL